jgi:hypothetical protein
VVGTHDPDLATVSRMIDLAEVNEPSLDGRVARRERNIENVLDVVLELFAEESLFPTIEQAAKRCTRDDFREQFEPELNNLDSLDRVTVVAACDLLTQLDAIDFLRRHRQLSADETCAAMRAPLRALVQR